MKAMPFQITLWTEFNMRQRAVFFNGMLNISLTSKVALSSVARAWSPTEGDRFAVLATVLLERQGAVPSHAVITGAVSHQNAPAISSAQGFLSSHAFLTRRLSSSKG